MSDQSIIASDTFAKQSPLFVVIGMHRSGTSMSANILHALGVNMGDSHFNISPENAKGHWERTKVVGFNDSIFGHFNRGWGQTSHILTMPEHWLSAPYVQELRRDAAHWLSEEMKKAKLFGFKDPRTTLLLPFWEQVFTDVAISPHYIFCVRTPAQVVRSLSLRDGMEKGQAEVRWMNYNVQAIRAIGSGSVCILPYERWFDDPGSNITNLMNFTTLPEPPPGVLGEIIDTQLRHDSSATELSSAAVLRLWHLILRNSYHNKLDQELKAYADEIAHFSDFMQPLLIKMEIFQVSVAEQRRVIGDLQGLVKRLRAEKATA